MTGLISMCDILAWAHCNTLQHTPTHCSTLQHTATKCNTLQHTATHWNTLQHTATHCNTLQHTATHCNTLQHTAAQCNTLQHTATHCNTLIQDGACHKNFSKILLLLKLQCQMTIDLTFEKLMRNNTRHVLPSSGTAPVNLLKSPLATRFTMNNNYKSVHCPWNRSLIKKGGLYCPPQTCNTRRVPRQVLLLLDLQYTTTMKLTFANFHQTLCTVTLRGWILVTLHIKFLERHF